MVVKKNTTSLNLSTKSKQKITKKKTSKKKKKTPISPPNSPNIEGYVKTYSTCKTSSKKDWTYAYNVTNSPYQIVRKLVTKGLYTEEDIIKEATSNKYPKKFLASEIKNTIYNPNAMDFLLSMYTEHPNVDVLFRALKVGKVKTLDAIYPDLISIAMGLSNYTDKTGKPDVGVALTLTVACSDGVATFNINCLKSEMTQNV